MGSAPGARYAAGGVSRAPAARRAPTLVNVLSGLRVENLQIGEGRMAERGARVTVRYTGYLNRGDVFQANVVAAFVVCDRSTIAGLSWGVAGMRVGGRRRLHVGPHLAYRGQGVPGVVPPNAKLSSTLNCSRSSSRCRAAPREPSARRPARRIHIFS